MSIGAKKYYVTLAVFCCLACSSVRAQTVLDYFDPVPNEPVRAITQQSNGRLIIGGDFTKIGATDKGYIGRIHIDGSLDTTFSASADNPVICLACQSDDKIVVGGGFEQMNGQGRLRIARLEADGSLDSSFNPGAGDEEDAVWALAIQPDGEILVGGDFTTLANHSCNRIGRLNSDGSLDSSFNADVGADHSVVYRIAIQPDGKIIIAGDFTSVNGQPRNNIARLNADGSLDASFDPNAEGDHNDVFEVIVQPDNKIIVAGNFTKIAGIDYNHIARLNADGSADPTFNPGTGADNGVIFCLLLQTDGKIVVGGNFTHFNGQDHSACVRLNSNGSVDEIFDIGSGFTGEVWRFYQQSDGKIVVGGDFSKYDSHAQPYLIRLYSSEAEMDYVLYFPLDGVVYAAAVQRNERILIGGHFVTINGLDHEHIGRTGPCYPVVDGSFTASTFGGVRAIIVQPDDKIIIGGTFTKVNDVPHAYIARLLSDGTIDPSFTHGTIAGGVVKGMALQPDGKIVIGGAFTTVSDVTYNGIARLNTNGTIDTSFTPGGVDISGGKLVCATALQSDGKILVGGLFDSLAGQSRNNIGRLNADGSLDTSFNPDMNDTVMCVAVQPDGKILVGGNFTTVGGPEHNRIVRLDTNGTVDASFNLPNGTDLPVRSIVIQCDGKIIIGGEFSTAGGAAHKYIARLNSDGSLDTTFALANDPNGSILAAAIQKDGKIICGGEFTSWGLVGSYLARIATTNAALQSLSVSAMGDSITWLRSGTSPELTRCIFEYSSDNATWSELGDGSRISGGWQIAGLTLPPNINFYVRATGLYCGSHYGASGSILDSTRLVYLTTPRVAITNVSGIVTGYYGGLNYTLSGTNNANVTGTMWWNNSLGGSSPFTASNLWSITVTGLSVGANTITIYGSNVVGDIDSNSVTIVQQRNDCSAADFDGDRLADPACYNSTNWYEWLSALGYNRTNHAYGIAGTFPVSADFDGDGLADPGVYDNRTGKWYIWASTDSYWQVGPLPYGKIGAAPVPADFDGDRLADFAVYAAGSWYVWFSTAEYQEFGPFNIGLADAIPVAGDFDGDRLADPAIYWKGSWYAWFSRINYTCIGPVVYGEADAFPIAADFDNDGLCDLATVSGSVWYVCFSTANYQQFGPFILTAEGWMLLPDFP